MREIKFRMFLGGRFHYWGFIKSRYSNEYEFRGLADTNAEPLSMEEKVKRSQQYTGLHDKNGKEIYEGDILSYKSETANKEPYEIRYKVCWGIFDNGEDYEDQECGCGVYLIEIMDLLNRKERFPEDKGRIFNYKSYHGIDNLEVIGNIYNPELLEG